MFLKSSLFHICIVESNWSVEWFFNLTREDYVLCLFSWVWVETHFPLSGPVINLLPVFIDPLMPGATRMSHIQLSAAGLFKYM